MKSMSMISDQSKGDEWLSEREVRLECLKLAKANFSSYETPDNIVHAAEKLASYALTGDKPKPTMTYNDIWDKAALACWEIAHKLDEQGVGDEGTMAGIIADRIEDLFRGKKPGEA